MVLVVSTITALATNFPQITVKAFILEHFGQQAFAVNGTLESVRALCAFVSQPLIGVLSDRYGRRLPLAACAAGLCLPHLVLALGASGVLPSFFVPWAIFYVLCGAFKGADSQVAAYIVDLVAPTHRAAALGINLAVSFGLSGAAGNLGGAYTTEQFGAAATFSVPVLLAMSNVAYVAFVLPESMPQKLAPTPKALRRGSPVGTYMPTMVSLREEEEGGAARRCARCCGGLQLLTAGFGLLRDDGMGALWRLCVANFMAYFVFFGFITNFQLFLQTSLNLSSTDCASYIATFSLFSLGTKSSILLLRRLLTERALITLGFCAFAAGCLLLATLAPTSATILGAAFMMAVGLIAAPVMASVASAITPSSRHGAVQALLQAFSSLSEGAGPAAFGWLLASLPGGPRAALPGLPFALGVAAAALGLCLSAGAIERGRAFARLASLPLGAPLLVGSSSPAL